MSLYYVIEIGIDYIFFTLKNYYSLMKKLKQQQLIILMNGLKLKEPSYLHRAE